MTSKMTRRFLAVTVSLAATVAFLIGLVVAGSLTPARAVSAPAAATTTQSVPGGLARPFGVVCRHRRAPQSPS